jgi:multisubunit Na+/H+ antiporter MnhC subunit
MWAQVVPAFQLSSRFAAALPSVYGGATANGITAYDLYTPAIELYKSGMGKTEQAGQIIADMGITADPRAQGVIAIAALVINVVVMAFIIQRSVKMGKNPYSNCVWEGTKDFEEAMARTEAA